MGGEPRRGAFGSELYWRCGMHCDRVRSQNFQTRSRPRFLLPESFIRVAVSWSITSRVRAALWSFSTAFTWARLPMNGQRCIRISRRHIRCWRWISSDLENRSARTPHCLLSIMSGSWLKLLRAKCGGERAAIVASGLSAGFATILAAQHPDLVHRLILLMPTGGVDSGLRRLAEALWSVLQDPSCKQVVLSALPLHADSDSRMVEEFWICGPGEN